MNVAIRQTENKSFFGNPIVEIKINGVWLKYESVDGDLREYDDSIKDISYTWDNKDEETGELTPVRKEISKKLCMISGGRVLGNHTYTKAGKENEELTTIVIWIKSKGTWKPAYSKGLSELTSEDMISLVGIL